MDCIDLNEQKARVEAGLPLSKPSKKAIIARMLRDNPALTAGVITHFEPRLAVQYDARQQQFTVGDLRAERTRSRVYAALAMQRELLDNAEAGHTLAFHEDTTDIAHMSNTVIVNQLLASIPLFKTPGLADLSRPVHLEASGFVNPQQAKDLLWRLAVTYPGYLTDHQHLKDLIEGTLRAGSKETTQAEDQVLYSLYMGLFAPGEVRFRDQYGAYRTTRSLWTEATSNPDGEVRQRAFNMLTNLEISISSVNDTSSLSFSTDREVFKALNDGTTEVRAQINRAVAFRIFDVTEDADGNAEVRLSAQTMQRLEEAKVSVHDHPGGDQTVSAQVPEMDAFGRPTGRRIWMHIPFAINKTSRRQDVAVVRNFDEFLDRDPLAGDRSIYENPYQLYQLFELAGYGDAIDAGLIRDFLENPKRQNGLHELYQLAANNLVTLSLNAYGQQRDNGRLSAYSPFRERMAISRANGLSITTDDTVKRLREAAAALTADATPERNQRNIARTLQHVFAGEADLRKVNTFIDSPLMNFVGNRLLSEQVMESQGRTRTAMQFNVNNDLVNKNTIVTNIENINRKLDEIRRLGQTTRTVFARDPYATGEYLIEDIFRYDGFRRNDESVGKSQMRMNEREINSEIHRYFGESIRQNYDPRKGGAYRADYFPEVNSDKSAFVGHSINTPNHNQFPLRAIQVEGKALRTVDVDRLIGEVIRVEEQHRQAFRARFAEAWAESGLVPPTENIGELLALIEQTPMPQGPIPLLAEKYFVKGQQMAIDGQKVTFFGVKEEVKNYLQPMAAATRRRQLLEAFAANHREVMALGLDIRPEHDQWLSELTSRDMQGHVMNDRTGATVAQADKKGVHVPAELQQIVTENRTDEQILRDIARYAHPLETAHYFNWLAVAPPISRLMTGDIFQYKGTDMHAMLRDRLKRSVQSVAPQMKMSLDEAQTTPFDRRLTRHSYTLQVQDAQFPLTDVLGAGMQGKPTDAYDGAALTFELAELMYQASYGGIHGLFPQASLKFIYGHTDNRTGDNLLLKYAVHRLSSEWLRQGTPRVEALMRLFMGSIPMRPGQTVPVNVAFGEHELVGDFDGNGTLYDIYQAIVATGTPLNPFQVLADIMATNQNPATGTFDLKDKYVTQIVFTGSAKTGQRSVHTLEQLEERAFMMQPGQALFDTPDAFNIIDNVDMGIQLDASHDPENTTISLVSQAITASVLENRTPELATELLQTLSAVTRRGIDNIGRVMAGQLRLEDTYTVTLADGAQADVPASALGFNDAGIRILEATGAEVTDAVLLAEKDIAYADLRLDGLEVAGWPLIGQEDAFKEYLNDPEFAPVAQRLFIRAKALKGMDAQGIYNTTYMAVEDNTFEMRDPQIEKVVASAVNSWMNRETIALKMTGGNYVVTPTYDLLHVYDVRDRATGEMVTVMKSELDASRYEFAIDVNGQPMGRNLKWKGFTKPNPWGDRPLSFFDTSHYIQYRHAAQEYKAGRMAKEQVLQLRQAMQQELEQGGWEVQPAEIILPYAFKSNFGLKAGMQPRDATVAFFYERLARMDRQRKLLVKSKAEVHALGAEVEVQEILDEWDFTGATEDAVGNIFARLFPQFNPTLLDTELAEVDAALMAKAEAMHADFQETLNAIVHRIPNSGMQSIATGRVVGFLEGNLNAILIPTELMIIQGADLDIDKSTVQQPAVSKDGRIHRPVGDAEGRVDLQRSNVKALENRLTELMAQVNDAPGNAIQTQTPVGLDRLDAQRKKRETGENAIRFHPDMPTTLVRQKILTAEGKAMTGLEANGLKMFGVTYFVRQATGRKLRSITLNMPMPDGSIAPVRYDDIANNDPTAAADQAWEFYSELVNAATDNAKEMILGAIGANLQSGNMINAMVMYSMDANTLFDFLSNEYVVPVLERMRHAGDITNPNPRSMTIEQAIAAELEVKPEHLHDALNTHSNREQALLLGSLLKMGQLADEFSTGASMLSINRSLPVSMYDKFNYTQKVENYFNNKLKRAFDHHPVQEEGAVAPRLDFRQFVTDEDYAALMEGVVESYDFGGYQVVEGVNLLSLARHAPHIKAYLEAKAAADTVLQRLQPVYAKTEEIIRAVAGTAASPFRNVTQDEYGAVVRYLGEVQTYNFVKDKTVTLPAVTDGVPLAFDLSKNEQISAFVYYFPSFLEQLKARNPLLERNPFFHKLAKKTDAKGQYLHIPNIDQLSENVLFDLRFGLNNGRMFREPLQTGHGEMTFEELQANLFLYSLIVGKGKVSKSSFFELFEPGVKNRMGYNAFLQGDTFAGVDTSAEALAQNLHVQLALPGFAADGRDKVVFPTYDNGVFETQLRNQSTYGPNPEIPVTELPGVISLYKDGTRALYQLTGVTSNRTLTGTVEYAQVQPRFPAVALSANTAGRPTHTTANFPRKTLHDPAQIEALLRGETIELQARIPRTMTAREVSVVTNVGTVRMDRAERKGRLQASRLRHPLSMAATASSKAAVQNFVAVLTERLQERFPQVQVEFLRNEEIVSRFGREHDGTVGLADSTAGRIYYNLDELQADTPMHEFGHIFMKLIRESDKGLYARITDLALREEGAVSRTVRANYPELSGERLGEEIFVTLLGYKSMDELQQMYPARSTDSWVRQLWDVMRDFFTAAYNALADVTGADRLAVRQRLSALDGEATLWDFLNSVSYEMLHGDVRTQLPRGTYEKAALRKAPKKAEDATDLLSTLITDPNVTLEARGPKADKQRELISKLRRYVRNDYYNKVQGKAIFAPYERAKLETLAEKLFDPERFDAFTENIYTLEELRQTPEVKALKGTEKVTVDFSGLQLSDPNVLVRVSILGKQVELELIDLSGRHQRHYNKHLKEKGLAGAFVSDREWRKLGGTFEASQRDADLLRLGVYAMQLREAGGARVKIGSLLVADISREDEAGWVRGTTIEEVVANVQALTKIAPVQATLSGELNRLLSKKWALDPEAYRANMVEHYDRLVKKMLNVVKTPRYADEYRSLHGELRAKAGKAEEVAAVLEERYAVLLGRDERGTPRTGSLAETERRVLAEAILQLHGVRNLYRMDKQNFVNSMQKYIDNPQATGVGIFDFMARRLANAMNRVRETVMVHFKDAHNAKQNALIKEYRKNNPVSAIEDWTMNDARKFFSPILEKVQARDASGNLVEVFTGRTIQDESSLSEAQRAYKRYFEEQVARFHKEMYGGVGYAKGYNAKGFVPLMKMQGEAAFKDVLAKGTAATRQDYKAAVQRWWDDSFNNVDYFYENVDSRWIDDRFRGQFDVRDGSGKYGNDTRLEMLGLVQEKGGLVVFDAEANRRVETDLSIVLDMFVANAAKKAEFTKAVPAIEAARDFVTARNAAHGVTGDHTVEAFDLYNDRFVNNRGDGEEEWAGVNKALNKGGSVASLAMLGLNTVANTANFATGFFSNYKEALYNGLLRLTGQGGEGMFSVADLAKATIKTKGEFDRMDQFNNLYGFNQLDFQSMNHERHRATAMGKFGSRTTYWLNFLGDAYNRATLFKAQMLKDGSWKAYEQRDGKLVYDEKKDPRFFAADGSQTPQQKALHASVKEAMKREGTLDAKGNMTRGYDNRTRNALKFLSDKVHGSYDNEMATNLNNYALGRLFLMFFKYMQNKIKTYVTGGMKGAYLNEVEGQYVERRLPSGEIVYEWEGTWNEGVWVSVWSLIRGLGEHKHKAWSALEPHQKRNLKYLTVDALMFLAIKAVIGALFGDDEEAAKEESPHAFAFWRGAAEAASVGFDLEKLTDKATKPFVTAGWISDQVKNAMGAASGDFSRIDELPNAIPHIGRWKVSAERAMDFAEGLSSSEE